MQALTTASCNTVKRECSFLQIKIRSWHRSTWENKGERAAPDPKPASPLLLKVVLSLQPFEEQHTARSITLQTSRRHQVFISTWSTQATQFSLKSYAKKIEMLGYANTITNTQFLWLCFLFYFLITFLHYQENIESRQDINKCHFTMLSNTGV